MTSRAAALLLAATLAACGGEIVTRPEVLPLEPGRVAHLRAPQAFALSNGLKEPVKHEIRSDSITWEVDARQLTDTAVVMLSRALGEQGIKPAPQAKTAILRVEVRGGMGMFVPIPTVAASARILLHADLGDGTRALVDGEGGSGFGMQPAFEGAIRTALYRLLIDPAFIAYMNR